MRGLGALRRLAARIEAAEGDPRERLRQAAFAFAAAYAEREAWPAGLRVEAERLRADLLLLGVLDGGLRDMDDDAVARAVHDLELLCVSAERACRGAGARPGGVSTTARRLASPSGRPREARSCRAA